MQSLAQLLNPGKSSIYPFCPNWNSAKVVYNLDVRFNQGVRLGIPMKVIGVPGDRDRDSGIEPISGRSEATLAVGFCRK